MVYFPTKTNQEMFDKIPLTSKQKKKTFEEHDFLSDKKKHTIATMAELQLIEKWPMARGKTP